MKNKFHLARAAFVISCLGILPASCVKEPPDHKPSQKWLLSREIIRHFSQGDHMPSFVDTMIYKYNAANLLTSCTRKRGATVIFGYSLSYDDQQRVIRWTQEPLTESGHYTVEYDNEGNVGKVGKTDLLRLREWVYSYQNRTYHVDFAYSNPPSDLVDSTVLIYDNKGNLIKRMERRHFYSDLEGGLDLDTTTYQYDNHPSPYANFQFDPLHFYLQPVLSKNNITKLARSTWHYSTSTEHWVFEEINDYKYNKDGLPAECTRTYRDPYYESVSAIITFEYIPGER